LYWISLEVVPIGGIHCAKNVERVISLIVKFWGGPAGADGSGAVIVMVETKKGK